MRLCQELSDEFAGGCSSGQADGGFTRRAVHRVALRGRPRPVPCRTWQAVSVAQKAQSLPLKPRAHGSQATKSLSQS